MPPTMPSIEKLTELRAGTALFRSNGVTRVKVTKDGVAHVYELEIQSTGVTEVTERMRSSAPVPPHKDVHVTPDSPIGKQMKFTRNEWVRVPDFSDAGYQEQATRHATDSALMIVNVGLKTQILKADGAPADTAEEKLAILRELGLSMNQFTQIVNDIQDLTTLTDKDRERFFGTSSAARAVQSS